METKKVWMEEVPLDKVDFIDNVRMDEDATSLMLSIRAQGLLEPIGLLVSKENASEKKADKRYLLVFGYKRFKAVKSLGWASISAMVSDIEFKDEKEMERYLIVTNLTENTYEKPSPAESGRKYKELMDKFSMSISEIHALTGEPEGSIKNDIAVYSIVPEEFRHDVTRSNGARSREGKLPVSVALNLTTMLKTYKFSKESNAKIWAYVKSNDVSLSKVMVVVEIMNRLGKNFEDAVALSQSCEPKNFRFVIQKKVMDELIAKYSLSPTRIVEGMLRGEIPVTKGLILRRETKNLKEVKK